MGLVLDSSVVIAAERQAKPVSDLLSALKDAHGEHEILLSAITVLELEHGLHRAKSAEVRDRRRAYLDTVFAAIPVQPFTKEIAQLAGKIDAEAKSRWSCDSVSRSFDRNDRAACGLQNRDGQYAALPNGARLGGSLRLGPVSK